LRHPIVIWLLLYSSFLFAQKDSVVVLRPDLKTFFSDSVNENVGYNAIKFSSLREQDEREAFGSVYVMDRRMIVATGARDIQELLQFVPSISFGRDVNDAVGIAMRGLWVHEGKFIIMINGMPINELSFGSYCFIKRLAIDNVSQVEIVLGPGSVNFGGTASLGVINIVTLKAGQRDGTTASITVSGTKAGIDRQNLALTGNHYLGNSTFFSYAFSGTKGSRASSLQGSQVNWLDSTRMSSEEFYIGIERKNLKAQVYQNDYNYSVYGDQFDVQMKTSNADLTYNHKIGSRNMFNAQIGYVRQMPWNIQNTVDLLLINSNTITEKVYLQSQFNSKFGKYFESNLGLQAYDMDALRLSAFADRTSDNALKIANGSKGIALFGEMYGRFRFGTLSIAGRMEYCNLVPPQMAPRVGYSLIRKAWHIKLSYSESYKIPTIENFYLGPQGQELLPERNRTSEFEIGGRFSKALTWKFNGYMNHVLNPIVYVFDNITYDNYLNRSRISNQGLETMVTYLSDQWTIRLGASYQELVSTLTDLPEIRTSRSHSVQGIPNFMGHSVVNYQLNNAWSVSLNTQFKGLMYNYEFLENDEEFMSEVEYKKSVRIHFLLSYIPTKWSDFEFRLGIFNALDQKDYYLSPYAVGLNTIPQNPRELNFSLFYRITH
jgi:outer membrane receptor protein involved in Fe transport